MEFNSGMLGVAIVVLGLIASCLFGVVMNVNQEEVEKDTDNYITDITGLYSTSAKDKTYTEYNPAKNYNGYTSSNLSTYPVEFKESSAGNNYSFDYDGIRPYTESRDFSDEATSIHEERIAGLFSHAYSDTETAHPYRIYAHITAGYSGYYGYVYEKNMKDVYNTLKSASPYPTAQEYLSSISISMEYHIDQTIYTYSASPPMTLSATATSLLVNNGLMITPTNYFSMSDSDWRAYSDLRYGYSLLELCGEGNTLVYTCTFNEDGTKFTVIASGPNVNNRIILNNVSSSSYMLCGLQTLVYLHMGNLSQYVEGTGSYTQQISHEEESYDVSEIFDYDVTYTYDKYISYLDPRYGITVRGGETVEWSNDYKNGAMDIVAYLGNIERDSSGTEYTIEGIDSIHDTDKDIEWRFYYESGIYSVLKMHHTANGSTWMCTQYYDEYTPIGQSPSPSYVDGPHIDLGTSWIGYNIHIDFTSGEVFAQAIPPASWNSFTDWTSAQPSVKIGEFKIRTNEIVDSHPTNEAVWNVIKEPTVKMQIISPIDIDNTIAMQITNTTVFMNTYGVVMIDPHIDILNWYPDNTHFKMKFTKIASIGSSIVINGQKYEISDGYLIVGDERVDLSDFEIEMVKKSTGYDITVASLKNGSSAEITDAINTEVVLNGAWYFTAGYYTVEKEMVKEYRWDVADGIAYGYTGVILFMMIFMGIITIAWWKIQPGTLTFFDIAIIIGVEVILFLLLG